MYNPPRVQEELTRRGLQRLVRSADRQVWVGEKTKIMNGNGIYHKLKQREVEEETAAAAVALKIQEGCQEIATLVALLKTCANEKDLHKGSRLHVDILTRGLLKRSIYIGNTLISMYAKCGVLSMAQKVFDDLHVRDVVSWTVLIAALAQHGHSEEALNCFERMQQEGVSPNAVTYACVLKACGSIKAVKKGKEIHAEIIRGGFGGKTSVLGTALVDMYAKCGLLAMAQRVFDELPARDVVAWTALIAGYSQHEHGEEALLCYEEMQREGLSPDAVTFASILKACGSIGAAEKGLQLHDHIVKEGLLGKDCVLGNALVDMYAKCGDLASAQEVFEELLLRDAVCWAVLIVGYYEYGQSEEALNYFERMLLEGLSPGAVTFACTLKACGSVGAAEKGKEIHALIVKEGLLEKDSTLGNALVDMYAQCGALAKAQQVFDELPVRDVVSWTALIAGYCKHGRSKEALNCFESLFCEGLSPDAVTFLCILQACGSIGLAELGKQIYAEIVKEGLLGNDNVLAVALVDMFAKCGALANAQQVFDELPVRDVVTWTALMAGYAQFGKHSTVLDSFNKMVGEGIEPDLVTFTVVLNACSHGGLVGEGLMFFKSMSTKYGVFPTLEHHTCMVELFSHAGHFDEAMAIIKKMPAFSYLPVWFVLLAACRKWGNVELARLAFEHAIRLDEKSGVAYVCLSNTYAAAGRQEDADKIEAMRKKKEAWKKPGCCWTDVGGDVHSFSVGDTVHLESRDIYVKLEDIASKIAPEGYCPDLHWASQDISNDARKDVPCGMESWPILVP